MRWHQRPLISVPCETINRQNIAPMLQPQSGTSPWFPEARLQVSAAPSSAPGQGRACLPRLEHPSSRQMDDARPRIWLWPSASRACTTDHHALALPLQSLSLPPSPDQSLPPPSLLSSLLHTESKISRCPGPTMSNKAATSQEWLINPSFGSYHGPGSLLPAVHPNPLLELLLTLQVSAYIQCSREAFLPLRLS